PPIRQQQDRRGQCDQSDPERESFERVQHSWSEGVLVRGMGAGVILVRDRLSVNSRDPSQTSRYWRPPADSAPGAGRSSSCLQASWRRIRVIAGFVTLLCRRRVGVEDELDDLPGATGIL